MDLLQGSSLIITSQVRLQATAECEQADTRSVLKAGIYLYAVAA